MSKRLCVIANSILLVWFTYDQFEAWRSIDGIWYLIFVGLFALFCIREKYGKYPLSLFLLVWIVAQFFSHWYYTIFGATAEQVARYNRFYADTWHIISASDTRIIPDFYHMVLHIFIIFALLCMVLYCLKTKKDKDKES